MSNWQTIAGKKPRFHKWDREGEQLEGTWLGTTQGPFGILGQIETARGTVKFSMSAVLEDALAKVGEGAAVRITFTGWATSKAGRRYRTFSVEMAA